MSTPLDSYLHTPVVARGSGLGFTWRQNEPEGLVEHFDLDMSDPEAAGTGEYVDYNMEIRSDGDDPVSPPSMVRGLISLQNCSPGPPNTPGQQIGSGKITALFPEDEVYEVYSCQICRPSSNLLTDSSGSKWNIWDGGNDPSLSFYENTRAATPSGNPGTRPIFLGGVDAPFNGTWLDFEEPLAGEIPPVYIPKNTWGMRETHMRVGAPGSASSFLKVWVNGVLQVDTGMIQLHATGVQRYWARIRWDIYMNNAQDPSVAEGDPCWWDLGAWHLRRNAA